MHATSNCILCFLYRACIVIQLCNVIKQNARFLNQCFNSILDVFYIFQTSCVHHQEEHMHVQIYGVFFIHFCKQCNRWMYKNVHSLSPKRAHRGGNLKSRVYFVNEMLIENC